MKILLINHHPVVARLLELSLKNDRAEVVEVETLEGIKLKKFDFVFLDESSAEDSIVFKLAKSNKIKSIFISYNNIKPDGFDFSLQKPFLPEQVIRILKTVESSKSDESLPSILDINEIDKIKNILRDEEDIELNGETQYKHEAIKQSIIENGLDIIEEDSLVDATLYDSHFTMKELALIEAEVKGILKIMKPKKIKKLRKGKAVDITLKIKGLG